MHLRIVERRVAEVDGAIAWAPAVMVKARRKSHGVLVLTPDALLFLFPDRTVRTWRLRDIEDPPKKAVGGWPSPDVNMYVWAPAVWVKLVADRRDAADPTRATIELVPRTVPA